MKNEEKKCLYGVWSYSLFFMLPTLSFSTWILSVLRSKTFFSKYYSDTEVFGEQWILQLWVHRQYLFFVFLMGFVWNNLITTTREQDVLTYLLLSDTKWCDSVLITKWPQQCPWCVVGGTQILSVFVHIYATSGHQNEICKTVGYLL